MTTIVADPVILSFGGLALTAETAEQADFSESQSATEAFADGIGLAAGLHL